MEPTIASPDAGELAAHANFLRRLARNLVRDESLADDLVQDTLVAAMEKPGRNRGPLRGWLTGVLKNLARMSHRERERRKRRETLVARSLQARSPGDEAAL